MSVFYYINVQIYDIFLIQKNFNAKKEQKNLSNIVERPYFISLYLFTLPKKW